jgi:hypothetical protein
MAPRRSDVSVCASCSPVAIPRASSRGGLLVAPSGRHPKGEMHAAKTFCVPQKLSSPPFSCRPAVAPLPFAARELTREMDNHHHRRKPGCTHETSTSKPPLKNLPGRWGKNKTLFLSHGSGWLRPLR